MVSANVDIHGLSKFFTYKPGLGSPETLRVKNNDNNITPPLSLKKNHAIDIPDETESNNNFGHGSPRNK